MTSYRAFARFYDAIKETEPTPPSSVTSSRDSIRRPARCWSSPASLARSSSSCKPTTASPASTCHPRCCKSRARRRDASSSSLVAVLSEVCPESSDDWRSRLHRRRRCSSRVSCSGADAGALAAVLLVADLLVRLVVQEIEFHRSLGVFPGVLPLLDAHLPERPSTADRAWLSMPVAKPIAVALADAPLETIVAAFAEIAATPPRLAKRGVGHRDVKPGNLYEFGGQWLIGDFGLVAAPDLAELTRSGRALGPAHYTAYEMILDPATADPLRADVYSFGRPCSCWRRGFPSAGGPPA